MKLDEIRKKKQVVNIFNIIFSLATIGLSGWSIYVASQANDHMIGEMFGIIGCVLSGVAFIMGVVLPSKEKSISISERTMKILFVLNLLLNDHYTSPSVMGKKQLYRSWNYMGIFVLSIFMILFNLFSAMVATVNGDPVAVYIGVIIAWILLDIGAAFWTYYDAICTGFEAEDKKRLNLKEAGSEALPMDPVEYGKKALGTMRKSTIIVVVFFLVVGVISYFVTEAQYKPIVDTKKINEEVDESLEKLDKINSEDFVVHDKYNSASQAVLSLKANYGGTKYYYILKYTDKDELSVISWIDKSEKIYVDCFQHNEDGTFERTKSFISNSITKADVEGKEDGVVE